MSLKQEDVWQRINNKEVFFIAEIGKNFIQAKEEQSKAVYLEQAKELVGRAKEAGADAVKFQTHDYKDEQMPVKVVAPHFKGEDRFAWVKRNSEITDGLFWSDLKDYCDELGILFFSTPMSKGAAKLLTEIDVKLWKVGSGDILDFVMLDYVRRTGLPIIISSGMSTLFELESALNFIRGKNKKIALLHCVSKYPCPLKELNTGRVKMFRDKFSIPVGFSDHSLGFEGVLQAIKCGATIIEKHFSLSRDLWGSDHKVSMTPNEFADMVRTVNRGLDSVRDNKVIMGKRSGDLDDRESEFRSIFRKSLVAGIDIKKGETIRIDMLYAMRPQGLLGGIKSERVMDVVGRKAACNIKKYEVIESEAVGLVGAGLGQKNETEKQVKEKA